MLTITRKLEFDAGHRIPDHKSQCRNLHGHRYTLEITLLGNVIDQKGSSDNGMIMDFSDVKALAKQHLVDVWDHAFLVYEEDTVVRAFLDILKVVFHDRYGTGLKLHKLVLHETPNCWAEISADKA
jgi:6-pyruvoyltetrahydropterin/6-carboxytetrahydropterin synthase